MLARLIAMTCAVVVLLSVNVTEANYQICGPKLNQIMRFVCNDTFNTKRSVNPQDTDKSVEIGKNWDNTVLSYLLDRRLATSILKNREFRQTLQKRDGGIVEECCYKSCSLNELQSYCAA